MSDLANRQKSFAASRQAPSRHDKADGPFLRRILFGLIAATIFSGAVTLALTSQHEFIEGLQVASAHGPA